LADESPYTVGGGFPGAKVLGLRLAVGANASEVDCDLSPALTDLPKLVRAPSDELKAPHQRDVSSGPILTNDGEISVNTASVHRYGVRRSTMNGGRLPRPWGCRHPSQVSASGTGPRIVLAGSWRAAQLSPRDYAVDTRCARSPAVRNHHLAVPCATRL